MRNKKNQRSSKSRKEIYLIILILLGISVGFATLATTLRITGNTIINGNTWDVKFDKNSIVESKATIEGTDVKVESLGEAVVEQDDNDNDTVVRFSSTIPLPGYYYEFTVNLVNNGSIDAMIEKDSIDATALTQGKTTNDDGETFEIPKDLTGILKYTIEYVNPVADPKNSKVTRKDIREGDAIHAGKSVTIRVRVEFDPQITALTLPEDDCKFDLSYSVNFVQSDDTAFFITTK